MRGFLVGAWASGSMLVAALAGFVGLTGAVSYDSWPQSGAGARAGFGAGFVAGSGTSVALHPPGPASSNPVPAVLLTAQVAPGTTLFASTGVPGGLPALEAEPVPSRGTGEPKSGPAPPTPPQKDGPSGGRGEAKPAPVRPNPAGNEGAAGQGPSTSAAQPATKGGEAHGHGHPAEAPAPAGAGESGGHGNGHGHAYGRGRSRGRGGPHGNPHGGPPGPPPGRPPAWPPGPPPGKPPGGPPGD